MVQLTMGGVADRMCSAADMMNSVADMMPEQVFLEWLIRRYK